MAGLERWKARHPAAAAALEPADVLVDGMRGRSSTWYRVRVNLIHVPEAERPAQEPLEVGLRPVGGDGHRSVAGRDGGPARPTPDRDIQVEGDDMTDIIGIDHIQLSMPEGGEPEARRFYGLTLGLREVVKPSALAGRGGCWFAGTGVAIHLGVEDGFAPLARAHPALLVRDLDAARAALGLAGVAITEDDSGLPIRRCYVHDPFGNRIELVDAQDAGFSLG